MSACTLSTNAATGARAAARVQAAAYAMPVFSTGGAWHLVNIPSTGVSTNDKLRHRWPEGGASH